MTAYTFGKAFTYNFYPRDIDGNVLTPSADSPTIYIYSDRPSRTEAQGGTGSVVGSSITSWGDSGNAKTITVPAIEDPDPDGTTATKTYYIAINYTLDVGGQTQTQIISFLVSRAIGYDNELAVAAADLDNYFSEIDGWESDANQAVFITEAIEDVKGALKSDGYEWAKITDIENLRLAVIHRALQRIALSQIASGESGFEILMEESKEEYRNKVSSLVLGYDTNLDSQKDTETTPNTFQWILR